MKKAIIGLATVLLAAAAWALPTIQEVEAQAQQGHYAEAEKMMSEVVAAKPGSAKAHYIYAEILAHERSFAKATEEMQRARQIDPTLTFTQPERFRAFEQLLTRQQSPTTQPRVSPSALGSTTAAATAPRVAPGIPTWVWLAGLVGLAFVGWRWIARSGLASPHAMTAGMPSAASPTQAMAAAPAAGAMPAPSAGVPYAAGMPAARPSSGLLGTGLAVAGGVAGGMMLGEMLHGLSPASGNSQAHGPGPAQADSTANELEADRSILATAAIGTLGARPTLAAVRTAVGTDSHCQREREAAAKSSRCNDHLGTGRAGAMNPARNPGMSLFVTDNTSNRKST